jgi:hypothetical protein
MGGSGVRALQARHFKTGLEPIARSRGVCVGDLLEPMGVIDFVAASALVGMGGKEQKILDM